MNVVRNKYLNNKANYKIINLILNFVRTICMLTLTAIVWFFLFCSIIGYIMWWPYVIRIRQRVLPRAEKYAFEFMTQKEFFRVCSATFILLGNSGNKLHVNFFLLFERLFNLWKSSGTIFLIKYMAEVMRLITVYLSGEVTRDNFTWVKVAHYKDKRCIPKVIPVYIRGMIRELSNLLECEETKDFYVKGTVIYSKNDYTTYLIRIVRTLLTILGLMRSMSGHHYLKFSSINAPHTGKVLTFDKHLILHVCKYMGLRSFKRMAKPKFFLSSKSGVNSSSAFTSISLDNIAFMIRPSLYIVYVKMCWTLGYYQLLCAFLLNSFLLLPLLLYFSLVCSILWIKKWFRDFKFPDQFWDLYLGRLAIVKEARGKARVIGITDHWTQWLLKPLHDKIYKVLAEWPEDGTLDQFKPVEILLNQKSKTIYSLDLTAATDRLPVRLQADILNALGYPGDLWLSLLKREYKYLDKMYYYSVGQPMGVYSSFAMLALCNHWLCASSLFLNGKSLVRGSGQYAILGDDVAIRQAEDAKQYTELLELLGVEVNPIKGFNGRILEFAKRLVHYSGIELSPIGAKSIVRSLRSPLFLVSVISDMIKKSFYTDIKVDLSYFKTFLQTFHTKNELSVMKILISIFGPQGGLWISSLDNRCLEQLEYTFDVILATSLGVDSNKFFSFWIEKYENLSERQSPFSGIWEAWKSLLILFNPLIWNIYKGKVTNHSQRWLGHMTALTISFTPLWLITRELLSKLFESLSLFSIFLMCSSMNYFGFKLRNFDKPFRGSLGEKWAKIVQNEVGSYSESLMSIDILDRNYYESKISMFIRFFENYNFIQPLQILTEVQSSHSKKVKISDVTKMTTRILNLISREHRTLERKRLSELNLKRKLTQKLKTRTKRKQQALYSSTLGRKKFLTRKGRK